MSFKEEIKKLLPLDIRERTLFFEKAGSTNDILKEMAKKGEPSGSIVIAKEQSGGRGRLGRSFFSPSGGLYLSILLKPETLPKESALLTACAAVSVCRAIERVCGINPKIKWVNDIILNSKKICGILSEMIFVGNEQCVVIGVGINVNIPKDRFQEDLKDKASSLFAELGREISLAHIAAETITELGTLQNMDPDKKNKYLKAYRKACITPGREVKIIMGEKILSAYAVCINEDFSLRVRLQDGSLDDITGGEVSVRGENGYL